MAVLCSGNDLGCNSLQIGTHQPRLFSLDRSMATCETDPPPADSLPAPEHDIVESGSSLGAELRGATVAAKPCTAAKQGASCSVPLLQEGELTSCLAAAPELSRVFDLPPAIASAPGWEACDALDLSLDLDLDLGGPDLFLSSGVPWTCPTSSSRGPTTAEDERNCGDQFARLVACSPACAPPEADCVPRSSSASIRANVYGTPAAWSTPQLQHFLARCIFLPAFRVGLTASGACSSPRQPQARRGAKPKYVYSTHAEAVAHRRERNRKTALKSYYSRKARVDGLRQEMARIDDENRALRFLLSCIDTGRVNRVWVGDQLRKGVSAALVLQDLNTAMPT
ncbi:hypothetical protein WJX72_005764 [[Myrmecia] bisecta]|uniref:BZIP domain-containing protein n=1 Tax=[Myrmecia] bisecta TaxID=41462 RepID=A0AAW1PDW6_9CHLO